MSRATNRWGGHAITSDEYRAGVAADMAEAVLQERVLALARVHGWISYHAPDNRPNARGRVQNVTAGFPDLVLINAPQKRVLWRELKTEKGRLSEHQKAFLLALDACGHDTGVWRPRDLLDGHIEAELTHPGDTP